jgi:hypothetical protein
LKQILTEEETNTANDILLEPEINDAVEINIDTQTESADIIGVTFI